MLSQQKNLDNTRLQAVVAAQAQLAQAQQMLQMAMAAWRAVEKELVQAIEDEELPRQFAARLEDGRLLTVEYANFKLTVKVFEEEINRGH